MPAEKNQNKGNIEHLFEGIADPVILHDLYPREPGQIILCNQRAMEITGYTKEELYGMTIADLGHPESGLKDDDISQKISTGEPVLFERIIVRKDKTFFPVEVHARLIDYDGKPRVLSLLRDISRRKKIEEETHLHLMFEKIVSNISSRFVNMPDQLVDKGIEKTLKEVSEFIGATRGRIFLLSEDGKSLVKSHEWSSDKKSVHKPDQKLEQDTFEIPGFHYFYEKLENLEDIILDKFDELPLEATEERKWFEQNGFNPIFYVPAISEEKIVGILGFTSVENISRKWPRQYGHLLRYISTIFYSALKRKELSRKLRLAQFTLDHYSDSVFWMDAPEFRITDTNPAACKGLGYTREEFLKLTVFDIDPGFKNIHSEDLFKELKTKKSLNFESHHRRKNGTEFPVEVIANYIEFEGATYIVAFAHDITSRKEAEKLLRQSEEEYRKIFENVADIFYEASMDGILLNVTPSIERITKYIQKDLIGQPMEVFYYDPSVRDPLLKKLSEKGEVLEFELDVKDKDGSPIPSLLNSKLIYNEDGKPDRIVGSLTDIRHRKKAEKQIRQLSSALHQSPVSVFITDTEAKLLYVNDSFVRFSGYIADDILGKNMMEITEGVISPEYISKLLKVVRKGKIWKGELDYMKKDGTEVWLSVTVSPVLDEHKKLMNFVAVLEEISERKYAEANLRKAKEEAEQSDLLKSAFLANMSHEIRTPMNAILGFSSLLKEDDVDEEQSNYYIDIINSKGRDLLRIISDIIDISRIEAGDLFIKMEPVEIFPFVREIYYEFRDDTQVKNRNNLQFRLNIPEPPQKIIVNTDPSRLKQVLVNLIQNAIKFTPKGFVEIGFEIIEKNNIRFFVRDSGIGIPENKKKIIFDRFRQIDDSHTREYGGTGLGLAICKNLLELMNCELSLDSKEDRGSEFRFKMKYILTKSPDKSSKPETENEEEVKLDLSGKKILIVEDDSSSYLFLESLLNRYSPEIIWAKSGQQALDSLDKNKDICLILMDIRMPGMNGLEATRTIRKKNKDIPIIAQTAYAQVTDRKMALESGCSDYISKPVSPLGLTKLLAKYLHPG